MEAVMPAIPESDLDRLEQYLNALERADSTMPLDMIQGLFCAVASAPEPVPPTAWIPVVLGEDHAFASDAEAQEITGLLMGLHNETARQLNEGEGLDFILYGPEGEEDLASWAEGYLIGVDLADPPWDKRADPDDVDNMLFPFLALTGEAKEIALDAGEEWMSEAEEAEMLAEVREGLANHLMDVRRHWFERSIPATVKREAPKVGRNDPCPCGSGKKYKGCHGR
jgi:uncharacterized protein